MCDTNLKKTLTLAAHLIPQNIPKNRLNLFDPAEHWVEQARSQCEERNRGLRCPHWDSAAMPGTGIDISSFKSKQPKNKKSHNQLSPCPFPLPCSSQNIQGNTTVASSVRRGTREAQALSSSLSASAVPLLRSHFPSLRQPPARPSCHDGGYLLSSRS